MIITETCLRKDIDDNVVNIPGYCIVRKDRSKLNHGGVCIYLKEDFEFLTLDDESRTDFESLWIKIRPHRLPRGFSSVVIGAIYHPPSADKNLMIDHLTETIILRPSISN